MPDAEVAAVARAPRPARRGTRRSRGSRAPARTSRAARCCRRSCRSGCVYGSSSRRSRLRRRSSTGIDAHLPRRDVEQHLASERSRTATGPRYARAAGRVRVDRLGGEAGAGARGTGRGTARPTAAAVLDRPRRGVGAAVGHEVDVGGLDRAVGVERHRARRRARGATCPAASRFSRRSSTHFTGTPTFGAASIRHISSRCTMIFWPKPPPVSRITTRMRCSGMPEQARAEQPHLVRRLRRRVDRELAGAAGVVDDEAAPLHRHRGVGLLVDRLARRRGRPTPNTSSSVVGGQAGDLADDVGAVAARARGASPSAAVGVVDDRPGAARSRRRPARRRPRRA